MTNCQSSLRCGDEKPQIKYKGIHEPKGRVKGFRVEIRPRNFIKKIWVGTFDKRPKAMRAFDAAVYLTGRDPYYFNYPKDYFPRPPDKPSREFVQSQAKLFAERTDVLEANPASFLVVNSKSGSVEASPRLTRASGTALVMPDLAAVEELHPPALPSCSKSLISLRDVNEFLLSVPYTAERIPALEWEAPVDAAKAGVAKGKDIVMETELAAFDKGYHYPDFGVVGDLLGNAPPEYLYPPIEGEDFIPEYSPSRPASKRKRDATEVAFSVTDDCRNVGSSATTTDVDDYLWNPTWDDMSAMTFNDAMKLLDVDEWEFLSDALLGYE